MRRAPTTCAREFVADEQAREPIRRRVVQAHGRVVSEPRVVELRRNGQADPQGARAEVDVMFDGVDRDATYLGTE